MADDPRASPTSAELKDDIDSGRTGDKVGGFDPAAAPLGTDSEAAGAPPTAGEVAQARRQERAPKPTARSNAAQPALAPDARMSASTPVLIGVALGIVAAVLFGVFLWMALH